MTPRLAKAILALGLLCIPLTASATGNLDCAIKDKNLDFVFESLFSYSLNTPLFQSKASFESSNPALHPALNRLDAEKLRLIQQWVEGKDLRLQFYAETDGANLPFAAVKLTIRTTAGEDEIDYTGSYELEITPAVTADKETQIIKLEGPASCSAG